ncbi:MAG TPA: TetR/AcrR family transcriptional regulator [Stellaceae bacterium]|nr:TetR/AcrR family transcriptional regulator [Stellaceae bacterium]
MPYSPEHKQKTRERIVESARRLFNRKGFAEVTIDEIMAEAGLTRGGFYKHFATKEELYADAVRQFLCLSRPEPWQAAHVDLCAAGPTLARMIVDAYLSREHVDDIDGSCPLVALPSDAARGNGTVKAAFREVLEMMVAVFQGNLAGPASRDRALALTALCIGAMVIARAVDEGGLADAFRGAARDHVMATTGWAA